VNTSNENLFEYIRQCRNEILLLILVLSEIPVQEIIHYDGSDYFSADGTH